MFRKTACYYVSVDFPYAEKEKDRTGFLFMIRAQNAEDAIAGARYEAEARGLLIHIPLFTASQIGDPSEY